MVDSTFIGALGVRSTAKDGADLVASGGTLAAVAVGDVILVKQCTFDGSALTPAAPTCTIDPGTGAVAGPTFTRVGSHVALGSGLAGHDYWKATVTVAGAMVVTVKGTGSGNARAHSAEIERRTAGTTFAQLTATPTTGSASAPSAGVTSTTDASALSWICSDTSGAATTSPGYRASAVQRFAVSHTENADEGTAFFASQDSSLTAGSNTVGMTAPTQTWGISVVEVIPATFSTQGRGGWFAMVGRFATCLALSAAVAGGVGVITHGQQVSAANSGITGDGISQGSLTAAGATTYSTTNQSVSGFIYSGTVNLSAAGITLADSMVIVAGSGAIGISVNNATCTVRNVAIISTSGHSIYIGIAVNGPSCTIDQVDIQGCENAITTVYPDCLIQRSYLHAASIADNSVGHPDVIEVYGGSATIQLNRLFMGTLQVDAPINIAPWSAGTHVDYCKVDRNFIDGGQAHLIVDNQADYVRNVEVTNNVFGGHTNPSQYGTYTALQNNDGRPIVSTKAAQTSNPEAIYWANNTWGECSDLTPDRTGQVAAAA